MLQTQNPECENVRDFTSSLLTLAYYLETQKGYNILQCVYIVDDVKPTEEELQELENIYQGILDRGECVSVKELAIDGKDLIAAGVAQGKQIGEILSDLLEIVLEEPEKNTKETLLSYVKETYF